jgi:hypothetical protein
MMTDLFDLHRAFCDRRQVVIPANQALTAAEVTHFGAAVSGDDVFDFGNIARAVLVDLEVPADGVHLEIAEGSCTLLNLPAAPSVDIEASIQGATLSLGGYSAASTNDSLAAGDQ